MDSEKKGNQNKVTEDRVKKATRKAFKKLLKSIESEPSVSVIESDRTTPEASEQTASEIQAFLFRRR